jgi:hypothetical protein
VILGAGFDKIPKAAIAASRAMADSVANYLIIEGNVPPHVIYVLALGSGLITWMQQYRPKP